MELVRPPPRSMCRRIHQLYRLLYHVPPIKLPILAALCQIRHGLPLSFLLMARPFWSEAQRVTQVLCLAIAPLAKLPRQTIGHRRFSGWGPRNLWLLRELHSHLFSLLFQSILYWLLSNIHTLAPRSSLPTNTTASGLAANKRVQRGPSTISSSICVLHASRALRIKTVLDTRVALLELTSRSSNAHNTHDIFLLVTKRSLRC